MSNINLKTQFKLLILGIIILLITVFIIVTLAMQELQQKSNYLYNDETGPAFQIKEIDYLTQRNRLLLTEMLIQPNTETIAKKRKELGDNEEKIDSLLKIVSDQSKDINERAIYDEIFKSKNKYEQEGFTKTLTALSEGRSQGLISEYNKQVVPLGEKYHDSLRKLVEYKAKKGRYCYL